MEDINYPVYNTSRNSGLTAPTLTHVQATCCLTCSLVGLGLSDGVVRWRSFGIHLLVSGLPQVRSSDLQRALARARAGRRAPRGRSVRSTIASYPGFNSGKPGNEDSAGIPNLADAGSNPGQNRKPFFLCVAVDLYIIRV